MSNGGMIIMKYDWLMMDGEWRKKKDGGKINSVGLLWDGRWMEDEVWSRNKN